MKSLAGFLKLFPFAADADEAAAAEKTLTVTAGDLKITARQVNSFTAKTRPCSTTTWRSPATG